ncbi:MAG: hypothetical protein IH614_04835 [Desulfuromonadales bacterium]|nr:hypothetical protein [Desulfuromonadales bacterium]
MAEDRYLLECGRYIERNPVRAGVVAHPGDYPWSSFHRHAKGQGDGVTDVHGIFASQFGNPQSYREFVCSTRDREEQELVEKLASGIVGSEAYQEKIRFAAISARRRKPGRPKFVGK